MRALLKGIADARHAAHREDAHVQMIGRTGKGLVTVQLGASRTFSVGAYRLCYPHDRSRRIAATDLARLPWNGKGPDPLQARGAHALLPAEGGEVPCNQGGGIMSNGTAAHDPSCGAFASRAAPDADYRDTSPASPGRSA